jgi:hypothetical protein
VHAAVAGQGIQFLSRHPNHRARSLPHVHRIYHDQARTKQEIATDISEKLQLRLSAEQKSKLTEHATQNSEAYQLYLKGQFFLFKTTEDDGRQAIEYFERAIDADPNYALPYTGLATAYMALSSFPQPSQIHGNFVTSSLGRLRNIVLLRAKSSPDFRLLG